MATSKRTTSKKSPEAPSVFDYLRYGESYTSLILGIIVVIIGTVLLLSLVRTRNITRPRSEESQQAQSITKVTQTETETVIETDEKPKSILNLTPTPTAIPTPTPTEKPTITPTRETIVTRTIKPTSVPTKTIVKAMPTSTSTPAKKTVTLMPTQKPTMNNDKSYLQGRTYKVQVGDNLWNIAERNYGSGYNWVDIARANKLSNPDNVKIGQKLLLPKAEQKNSTSEPEWVVKDTSSTAMSAQAERINPGSYTIKMGDSLWSIAVRAYGDGYQWVKLRDVNKLSNPDIIFPGEKLTIPKN